MLREIEGAPKSTSSLFWKPTAQNYTCIFCELFSRQLQHSLAARLLTKGQAIE